MTDERPDLKPQDVEIDKLPQDLRERLEGYRWYTTDREALVDIKWLAETVTALRAERDDFRRKGEELCCIVGPLLLAVKSGEQADKESALTLVDEIHKLHPSLIEENKKLKARQLRVIVTRRVHGIALGISPGEYPAGMNQHGAVFAILPDGKLLGLKPGEFRFKGWKSTETMPTRAEMEGEADA